MDPKPLLAQRLKRLTPRPINRFAEKVGIEPARYYAYLAGERPPDETLAVIARHLEVSMDDLLAPDASPEMPASGIPITMGMAAGLAAQDVETDGDWREISRTRLGDLLVVILHRQRSPEPPGLRRKASAGG